MKAGGDIRPAIRHLVLWLTTDCNLSCAYCYRGQPSGRAVMSRETMAAALELAAHGDRPFKVQLAGGEPTLEPDLMEFAAREVRRRGWPATLAVQTNGVSLTRDLAEMLRRRRIQAGVSLDGPWRAHESLRGRFAETMHGLEALEQAGVDFGVTAVVSAENVGKLSGLATLLSRFRHARGLGLDLLVRRGHAEDGWPRMAEPEALREAMQELARAVAWINQRRTPPLVLRELERIKNGGGVFCQAALGGSLAVHPNGSLYPCGQTMGDEDLCLGSLQRPDFSKMAALGRYELGSGHCAGCRLEGRCPGECPSRLKYNGDQGRELSCAMWQGLALGLGNDQANHWQTSEEQGHAAA